MSIGAVSAGGSPLHARFGRVAESRTPDAATGTEDGDGTTPTVAASEKQLAEAQQTLSEHVRAGADERTIRMDEMRVQAIAAALGAVLEEQVKAAEKAARWASGDRYL